MINRMTIASAATLLVWATPAAAQLDDEGMQLINDLNRCVEKNAFENDDGEKYPEVIADQSLAKCDSQLDVFENYLVRHSVKMTDEVRGKLRKVQHDMAVKFVLLNRKAGRVHARNR